MPSCIPFPVINIFWRPTEETAASFFRPFPFWTSAVYQTSTGVYLLICLISLTFSLNLILFFRRFLGLLNFGLRFICVLLKFFLQNFLLVVFVLKVIFKFSLLINRSLECFFTTIFDLIKFFFGFLRFFFIILFLFFLIIYFFCLDFRLKFPK